MNRRMKRAGHRNIERMKIWFAAAVALSALACGSSRVDDRDDVRAGATVPEPARGDAARRAAVPGASPASSRPRIVVLGDSLTAGLGLPAAAAYPSLLEQRLEDAGLDFEVVNAGVSGDTSAGGLRAARLGAAGRRARADPGAGGQRRASRPAGRAAAAQSRAGHRARAGRGIAVILAGMEAPPNYGRDYIAAFHKVYPELAAQYHVAFVPFLLQGVAGIESLNQRDGIHPTAAGRAPRRRQRVVRARADCPGPRRDGSRRAPRIMIELREVSKTVISGTEPLTILHPLTLQIPHGQFVAIVGPSGSGKSTLLGLIAGLDAPTSGSVLIDSVDITRLDEDSLAKLRGEKIGFVFQFFHLIPSLTAYENVAVPMEIAGLDDARPRAEQLLEEVGLTGRAHHYPSQLSGGEQQRVALARALANNPPIVLADEPTGNLDSANGRHIMELLRTIHHGRGTTIVLVTHDAELAAIADARLTMRDGRVVENTLTDRLARTRLGGSSP